MNKHPWLCGEDLPSFRYGDYSAIKRSYLPPDYAKDSARFRVAKTVHMEAEWDPADPLGETRWLESLHARHGRPNAIVGQIWFERDDVASVLAGHATIALGA